MHFVVDIFAFSCYRSQSRAESGKKLKAELIAGKISRDFEQIGICNKFEKRIQSWLD